MVFFVCDACGQSFKKNQVEKHLRGCKKCQFMSCIDCNQEFWGDDYKAHIKCISEDQKYGGKNYKPKTSSNKGENKQNDWMELIREVISTSNVKPHLVHVMQEIVQQPNLPRKQAKFEKFLENSLRHKNPEILKEAWNIFSKAQDRIKTQKGENKQQVVSASEGKENSKIAKDENGDGRENTITEELKRKHSQSKKQKGKYETNEIETNSYEEKIEKQENTEVPNSNKEAKIKHKKSHKKKNSKEHPSDEQGNKNVVSRIPESLEVPDFPIVIKKKNKKRKRDQEGSEDHDIETSNVVSVVTESIKVSNSSVPIKKKNKNLKLDKEENEANTIETSNMVSDGTESIVVPDSSVLKKKKKKNRKLDKEENVANTIETSNMVSDGTESIMVSDSSVLKKKRNKKHKHEKEGSEVNAIEHSKRSKFGIADKDILEVKDSQIDVTFPKKKKKKH